MSSSKRIRQTRKQASCILSADWHLRPDVPVCRTDDYFAAMGRKVDFVLALSKQNNCPILVAGDLGQWAENKGWPTWLTRIIIKKFRDYEIICLPGQHDLPNHKLELWIKSGLGVLEAAGVIKILGVLTDEEGVFACHFPYKLSEDITIIPFPFGSQIRDLWEKYKMPPIGKLIAMTHQPVLSGKSMFDGIQGLDLLKQFPEYSIILSGDNHMPFVVEYEGRKLVNPGSMMRNTADQADHKPRVYLWYAEDNTVEPVYLPIEPNVISREHIDVANERSDRFDALISRVKSDVEIKLSYETNIEAYFQKYRTEKRVKEKTWQAIV